ncbi:MAG TPA: glycosyltransferase [Puia sp.]|nr:glycosyltransferase [Puia sp.]
MVLIFLSTLLGCCLLAGYGALIEYYRRAWQTLPEFDAAGRTGDIRISVLVPARNEAANIAACIESLADQTYPKELFEVIVIDDHSTDGTAAIVRDLHPPGLRLMLSRLAVSAAGPAPFKKLAIESGVRIATGDLIVTTDADCRFQPDWLNTLAVFYREKQAKFIAAPVRMSTAQHSLLAIFQMLDFITLQGITAASVAKKFHSMCNGANLAYDRAAFFEVAGFRDIDDIPSGDDMLLMYKIYRKYPDAVYFLKSPAAIVSTKPEPGWTAFVNQRVRWASKADRYDDRRIFRVLLLVYILNAALLLLPVAACWNRWWLWLFVAGLLVKTLLEYPFVSSVAEFFGQESLMRWFPVLQPFHLVYTVVIGWMGKFASYSWKDRTVRR